MANDVLKGASVESLVLLQKVLKDDLRRVDAALGARAPHGIRVEVYTTTHDKFSVEGILMVTNYAANISDGRNFEIMIHEQAGPGANLWEPQLSEDIREKYGL